MIHDDNVIGSITRSKSGSVSLSGRFRSLSPSSQVGSSSSTVDSNDLISRLPDNNNAFSTVILSLVDLSDYPSNSDIAKRNSKGKWQEIEYNFVLRVTDESTRFNFLFPLPDHSPSGIVELLNVWFITLRRPNKIVYKLAADSPFDTIDLKLQKKLVNELKKYLGPSFIASDEYLQAYDSVDQLEGKEDEFMNDLKSLVLASSKVFKTENWSSLLPIIANFLNSSPILSDHGEYDSANSGNGVINDRAFLPIEITKIKT
ncbi:unnamed protein product [[Candida] boidinii]|nr:unnamed protein product [[Candida] boidinii]